MHFINEKLVALAAAFTAMNMASAQDAMVPAASFLGTHAYERVGYHLHLAGDVNRDGFADFLVGTFHNQERGHDAGAAYLILGKQSPDWGFHYSLNQADARFLGDRAYDAAGYCLGGGGDVNGDGFDDMLIGAPAGNEEVLSNPGHVYVVFGKASPDWGSEFRLAKQADASFDGEEQHNFAGLSLAIIGDVNQDGYDDIVCGSPYNDYGNTDAGKVHLILGRPSGWNLGVNLSQADASFYGKRSEGLVGYAVDGVGDVNGDGVMDFAIGARGEAGAYLIFGRKNVDWGMNFDLRNADVHFESDQWDDWTGWRVSRAGDVNQDGFDDMLVGAPRHRNTDKYQGRVSLILGRETGWFTDLNDADANFHGEKREDQAGWDTQDAGDVDADGFDDFLIGAWQNDESGVDAGKVYVIKGRQGGWRGDISLADIDHFFVGAKPGEYAGFSVASAGDVTGNGASDIIASSTYDSEVDTWSGKINLFINEDRSINVALPFVRAPKNSIAHVPVLVQDVSGRDVRSCQFQVKWDAAVLEPVGVSTVNTLMERWTDVAIDTGADGTLEVQASDSQPLAAGDTLIFLDFKVVGAVNDSTALRFDSFEFNAGEIVTKTSDGQLTVDPPLPLPPAELSFGVDSLGFGSHYTTRSFFIRNDADTILDWRVESIKALDLDISAQPDSGVLGVGDSTWITVRIDRAALAPGDYLYSLRLTSRRATNCPQSIPVTISAQTWPIEVGRYRLFETDFISRITLDNPYTDASLTILVTTPSGLSDTLAGYWHAGEIWKCRIMPLEQGKHTYTTISNIPELHGIGGEFLCQPSDHPGMLIVDPNNPHGFALSETGPIFWMGETAWRLMSNAAPFSDGTFQKYIDTRKKQGFNQIHFVLVAGGSPFGMENPVNEGGPLWFSQQENRINPAFFEWMDRRVAYMDSSRMALGFFITWAQQFAAFSTEDLERLERYLIARYSAYPLLHWVIVGEFEETGTTEAYNDHGALFKNADPYHHLVSIHPGHADATNPGTNRIFADHAWCDYIMHHLPINPGIDPASVLNEQTVADRAFNKPVVNNQFGYEGQDYAGRILTSDDVRRYAWAIACGGGFFSYGHAGTLADIHLDSLQSHGAEAMQRLLNFFNTLEWPKMTPQNEIVENGFCLAASNERYIMYLPDSGMLKIDFTNVPGLFLGDWFNPETGERQRSPLISGHERSALVSPFKGDAVLDIHAATGYGIQSTPDTLWFRAVQGVSNLQRQKIVMTQIGEGALAWTATATPEQHWLRLEKTHGGQGDFIEVVVNSVGLSVGKYQSWIRIDDPNALNSPMFIPIFLKINPAKKSLLAVETTMLDFGAKKSRLSLSLTNSGSDALAWRIERPNLPWIKSVTPQNGLLAAGQSQRIMVEVNRSALSENSCSGEMQIFSSNDATELIIGLHVTHGSEDAIRIDCGSGANYIDNAGNEWLADRKYDGQTWGYIGGCCRQTTHDIGGTTDARLFQSQRRGMTGYVFRSSPGQYEVRLLFAEIDTAREGAEPFSVQVGGENVLSSDALLTAVGRNQAVEKTFATDVMDGELNIQFQSPDAEAWISAIEIRRLSSPLSTHSVPDSSAQRDHLSPKSFHMCQNFPNPFNPSTSIRYEIPASGRVTVTIFNILGEELATLVDAVQSPGIYTITWEGDNSISGVFLCRIRFQNSVQRIKMLKLQ